MIPFKTPTNVPQDLLLIRDLLGPSLPTTPQVQSTDEDNVSSSGSESEVASEEEIEADLIAVEEEETESKMIPESPVTDTDSDSDSDSDSEDRKVVGNKKYVKSTLEQDYDDDDEPVPVAKDGSYFQTKHEIADVAIIIPDIDEVGLDEKLEKVGEIMVVMDRVVIVAGIECKGSEHALDSETLLVFDDRKVLGYVFETFGPTTRPLYQIKFNKDFTLDPERIHVGREVFHIPIRSRFVFLSQINIKGSDASNVHDEEPGEDELEFSDDEAEQRFKSSRKRKRTDSYARSVASSRHSTPNPSHMRDQEMVNEEMLYRNAYDEHGPYDIDFNVAGPSRRKALPYDDPYSEEYTAPEPETDSNKADFESKIGMGDVNSSMPSQYLLDRGKDIRGSLSRNHYESRGRGRGRVQGGGRGRDTRFGQNARDRGGNDQERVSPYTAQGTSVANWLEHATSQRSDFNDKYDLKRPRPRSPALPVITRPTDEVQGYSSNSSVAPMPFQSPQFLPLGGGGQAGATWGYRTRHVPGGQIQFGSEQQMYHQPYMQMPFVQPHINPRFASAFGISYTGTTHTHGHQYSQTGYCATDGSSSMSRLGSGLTSPVSPTSNSSPDGGKEWLDEWTVPVADGSSHPIQK